MIIRALALAVPLLLLPTPALAADSGVPPATPQFDRSIEDYANDDDPTVCDGSLKPGTVAFRDLILRLYPDTGSSGILACQNNPSDHNEGRAWDWTVSVDNPEQKAIADRVISWLLAPDEWGNPNAMLRRLGIKYIIWNRQIWGTWNRAWSTYFCNGTPSSCHTNHVHFSFTVAGALRQTSWWTGYTVDGPTVAARPDRTDLFLRRSDGTIAHLSRTDGPWSAPESLGGFAKSAPAAAWVGDELHLYERGIDDWVYCNIFTLAGGWLGWTRPFGPVTSSPAVTSAPAVLPLSPTVLPTASTPVTPSTNDPATPPPASSDPAPPTPTSPAATRPPTMPTTTTATSPAATPTVPPTSAAGTPPQTPSAAAPTDAPPPPVVHVFARNTSGGVSEWRRVAGVWQGPYLGGGVTSSGPTAVYSRGLVTVAARWSDNTIYQRSYDVAGDVWGAWAPLPNGDPAFSGPASVSDTGMIEIFVRGGSGVVFGQIRQDGGDWQGWVSTGGDPIWSAPAVSLAHGPEMFGRGRDGSVLWRQLNELGAWGAWTPLPGVSDMTAKPQRLRP